MVWVVAFCFSFPFFFWLFRISSLFHKVYQEAVAFMYWTQFPRPTSKHIEPVLGTNWNIGMVFTHSTSIRIITTTWVTWKLSEIEDSCGAVKWHLRAHSTFKWRSSLLIINLPIGICARIVFYAIYGGDVITRAAVCTCFCIRQKGLATRRQQLCSWCQSEEFRWEPLWYNSLESAYQWRRHSIWPLGWLWSARNEQSWVSVKEIFNFL